MMIKNFITSLLILGMLLGSTELAKAEPFKLLTVEPAFLPPKKFVVGLQSLGYSGTGFFVDTNPLLDLFATPNLGVEGVFPVTETVAIVAGGRYLQFTGSDKIEEYVKQRAAEVEKFQVHFSGYTSFLGFSYSLNSFVTHFNFQYADVSGSKVASVVGALSIPLGSFWSTVVEAGYDASNKQPRASFGFVRQSTNFGARIGATYIKIHDPAYHYEGAVPVLDLFWNFGGSETL